MGTNQSVLVATVITLLVVCVGLFVWDESHGWRSFWRNLGALIWGFVGSVLVIGGVIVGIYLFWNWALGGGT